MICANCGRIAEFAAPRPHAGAGGIVLDASTTHADREQWARYCAKCDKVLCGECCYPEWQALKKKEGLSGRELAAKLERTPGAAFFEMATCPFCGEMPDSEYSRPNIVTRLLTKLRGS